MRVHILENGWVARHRRYLLRAVHPGGLDSACDGFALRDQIRPAQRFRAWPWTSLQRDGPNAVADFDPIVQRVEVVAVASQLGVEDAACSGSHTRFQREYLDSHHGYAIPEVQFPVRNSDGRQPARYGTSLFFR